MIWGRDVCPLCYVLLPECSNAHAVVLGVFAHLSTPSSHLHMGAQTGFFWMLTGILEVQQLASAAQPTLITLTSPPSDQKITEGIGSEET